MDRIIFVLTIFGSIIDAGVGLAIMSARDIGFTAATFCCLDCGLNPIEDVAANGRFRALTFTLDCPDDEPLLFNSSDNGDLVCDTSICSADDANDPFRFAAF